MSAASDREHEFFVGYAGATPRGIVRRVRRVVLAIVIGSIVAAAAAAGGFRAAGTGFWTPTPQSHIGQLVEKPYPMLRVPVDGRVERVLLVAPGKHGAGPMVAGRDGEVVSVWGTLLVRDGRRMVELAEEPGPGRTEVIERATASAVVPAGEGPRRIEHVTLAGEIVDSKCYLGAMKPGDGKAHKACAVLCISGGIPPMLVGVPGSESARPVSYYLLVGASGQPLNNRVLPFVAEAVEVTGVVEDWEGLRVLRVDDEPAALRRR